MGTPNRESQLHVYVLTIFLLYSWVPCFGVPSSVHDSARLWPQHAMRVNAIANDYRHVGTPARTQDASYPL